MNMLWRLWETAVQLLGADVKTSMLSLGSFLNFMKAPISDSLMVINILEWQPQVCWQMFIHQQMLQEEKHPNVSSNFSWNTPLKHFVEWPYLYTLIYTTVRPFGCSFKLDLTVWKRMYSSYVSTHWVFHGYCGCTISKARKLQRKK